jgi:hypothetical protein
MPLDVCARRSAEAVSAFCNYVIRYNNYYLGDNNRYVNP